MHAETMACNQGTIENHRRRSDDSGLGRVLRKTSGCSVCVLRLRFNCCARFLFDGRDPNVHTILRAMG